MNRLWPHGPIRMGIVYRMVRVPRHAPCPPTSMINARRTMVYNGPYPLELGQNLTYSGSFYAEPLPRRKLKEAILFGEQPRHLKLSDLMNNVPVLWSEQQEVFGLKVLDSLV